MARRTEERDDEVRSSDREWAMQVSRHARSIGPPVERRLQALDRTLECNHPTADIDEMLADIERGRDLR